jgi:hypothetical protein
MFSNIAERKGSGATDDPDESGCAYVLDGINGGRPAQSCGAARRPGSAYCPAHHARCRLEGGSPAEQRRLREIEALASAAGGKQGHPARQPTADMLRRLERAARRVFARPECSCIVPETRVEGGYDAADG